MKSSSPVRVVGFQTPPSGAASPVCGSPSASRSSSTRSSLCESPLANALKAPQPPRLSVVTRQMTMPATSHKDDLTDSDCSPSCSSVGSHSSQFSRSSEPIPIPRMRRARSVPEPVPAVLPDDELAKAVAECLRGGRPMATQNALNKHATTDSPTSVLGQAPHPQGVPSQRQLFKMQAEVTTLTAQMSRIVQHFKQELQHSRYVAEELKKAQEERDALRAECHEWRRGRQPAGMFDLEEEAAWHCNAMGVHNPQCDAWAKPYTAAA